MIFRRMVLGDGPTITRRRSPCIVWKVLQHIGLGGSPIFLPRFGSVFSRTTSFVLKMIFFSYMAEAGVRESMRTRDMGWSFRHSSRITNLLECVFTLDHCIYT